MAEVYRPRYAARLGMALQTGLGSPAAAPTLIFPVDEAAEMMDYDHHYMFGQYADGHSGLKQYWSEGEWASGNLTIPLMVGTVDPTNGEIGKWAWGRDSSDSHQGVYATIFRDLGGTGGDATGEIFADCKVKSGSLDMKLGPIKIKLEVEGIAAPGAFTGSWAGAYGYGGVLPYEFGHGDSYGMSVALSALAQARAYGLGGSGTTADTYTFNHVLNFDNKLPDPKSRIRATESNLPAALPNMDETEWKGTFDRDFVDTVIYQQFLQRLECSYFAELTHPTGANVQISLPRIKYTEGKIGIPAKDEFIEQKGIPFQGLAAVAGGGTAPTYGTTCIITESVSGSSAVYE